MAGVQRKTPASDDARLAAFKAALAANKDWSFKRLLSTCLLARVTLGPLAPRKAWVVPAGAIALVAIRYWHLWSAFVRLLH